MSGFYEIIEHARQAEQTLRTLTLNAADLYFIARESRREPLDYRQMTFSLFEEPRTVEGLAVACGKEVWDITPWALRQLCERLNVLEGYIMRCPPALKAHNLNYWLSASGKRVLIRLRDGVIKGALSLQFSPLSHVSFLEALHAGMAGKCSIRYAFLDDELLQVVFSLDGQEVRVPGEAGVLVPAITALNSEVGGNRVTVAAGIWSATDDAVFVGPAESGLERQHQGIKALDMAQAVRSALVGASEEARRVQETALRAGSSLLALPFDEALARVVREMRLPAGLREIALSARARSSDEAADSLFSLAAALARAAGEYLGSERLMIQQVAGQILWNKMPSIAP